MFNQVILLPTGLYLNGPKHKKILMFQGKNPILSPPLRVYLLEWASSLTKHLVNGLVISGVVNGIVFLNVTFTAFAVATKPSLYPLTSRSNFLTRHTNFKVMQSRLE